MPTALDRAVINLFYRYDISNEVIVIKFGIIKKLAKRAFRVQRTIVFVAVRYIRC